MNVLLIDGSYLLHRYYHIHRDDVAKGVMQCMYKLSNFKNDYNAKLMVVFDSGGSDYRNAILSSYKGNRKERDAEFFIFRDAIIAAISEHHPVKIIEGVEADDVIATYCKLISDKHFIYVLTGDKDLLQLVNERVSLLNPFTYAESNVDNFSQLHGMEPCQIVDYLTLLGDNADNIPGVYGIGKKTAKQLLTKYGSIDNMLLSTESDVALVKGNKPTIERNTKLVSLLYDVDVS